MHRQEIETVLFINHVYRSLISNLADHILGDLCVKSFNCFFYDDKFQIDVFNGLTLLKCQYYKSGLNDYLMAKLHLFSLFNSFKILAFALNL